MKKYLAILLFLATVVGLSASTVLAEVREVTVTGDPARVSLVAGLITDYLGNVHVTPVTNDNGEYVVVQGPTGTEKIHFSPKLVAKLQSLRGKPRAGHGLWDICPTQARQLNAAIGKSDWERISAGKPYCSDGSCWPRNPTGNYTTMVPYGDIRVVWNSSNPKYPANSTSFKVEYHEAGLPGWPYGTGWGPTIVFRNMSSVDPNSVLAANGPRILNYLNRISAIKRGQSGREGDSCYEVTIVLDGTVIKNESPPGTPY